ncbi:MAG: 2Fe-2S iron-sulfur cluster-binding protein, partial [Acidimicrobiia bacterium]
CVTPVRRVRGRHITTVEGLPPADAARWAEAFCATGASQCGFCSPGIVLRLHAEAAKPNPDPAQALLAHLCRCTGWLPILDAFALATNGPDGTPVGLPATNGRDLAAASARATLEGASAQRVAPEVALGAGGFADDTAPADALVAVTDGAGGWVLADTAAQARRLAGKIQGRRTTAAAEPPLDVPPGTWGRTLRTSWVDPGYVETDAVWCAPDGEPVGPLGNGGAFGSKRSSPLPDVARELARARNRPVRVLWSREDAVRYGPKRPPLAAGIDPPGRAVTVHVARTPGVADALRAGLGPDLTVDIVERDVPGPPTSVEVRAAGWAEGVCLRAAVLGRTEPVTQPGGGTATVSVDGDGVQVRVVVDAAADEVVVRSYCTGAVHMALSWVTSEALRVTAEGEVEDLTVRSLGILRAVDMPPVQITVERVDAPAPLAVSDAVFAATAAAVWQTQDWAPSWPTQRPVR